MNEPDCAQILHKRWLTAPDAGSHGEHPRPSDAAQAEPWHLIMEQAAQERVTPLLYSVLRDFSNVPQSVLGELHDDYVYTTLRNRGLQRALVAILAALKGAAIPIVLLKGAALAFAVYDDSGLRPMTDLDVLIRRSDVEAAAAALAPLGYVVQTPYQATAPAQYAVENELVLMGSAPAYTALELHWHLFDSPHYQRVIDQDWLWQTTLPAEISSQGAFILGPEAQILHLCGHLALHHEGEQQFGNSPAKLLWLADIAEAIHHYGEGIDWDLVLEKAQAFDLVLSLRLVLGRVDALWPGVVPAKPLATLRSLTASPAEQRVFALLTAAHRPTAQRFYADLAGMADWRTRLCYAAQQLFPTPFYMGERYEIRRRWLLPLAYPYRWCVGLSGLWRRKA